MKRMALALFCTLLLGFGCNSPEEVRGLWKLTFTLPDGWVMASSYNENENYPLDTGVVHTDQTIALQSARKKFCMAESACIGGAELLGEGDTVIVATVIDSAVQIPPMAEDLGNNFFRLKICDDGGPCMADHRGNYQYFLKTEAENYQFFYWGNPDPVEGVITSGKVVNKYLDATE
jgi:hypothetical protein